MVLKLFVFLVLIKISTQKILVRNATTCGKPFIQLKLTVVTNNSSQQLLSGIYSSKVPNGDNMESSLKLLIQTGTKWIQLTKLTEKQGVCAQLDRLIGPLFHDVERAAGIVTKCPIPAGTFRIQNYRPSFDMMKLQLPPGKIRVNLEVIEKATKKLAMCLNLDVENVL